MCGLSPLRHEDSGSACVVHLGHFDHSELHCILPSSWRGARLAAAAGQCSFIVFQTSASACPGDITGILCSWLCLPGTSMSSPHIAGIAALLMQKHPNWSPMAVKSAMLTTAYQQTKTGPAEAVFGGAFDFGSGHIDPTAALDPGLLFDSNAADWTRFLCGSAQVCTLMQL